MVRYILYVHAMEGDAITRSPPPARSIQVHGARPIDVVRILRAARLSGWQLVVAFLAMHPGLRAVGLKGRVRRKQ